MDMEEIDIQIDDDPEFKNGVFFTCEKGNQCIRTDDGNEHTISDEDYVEYCAKENAYFPLNQQFHDNNMYYSSYDNKILDGLRARYRKAREGERLKTGNILIDKNKILIEFWDGTKAKIEDGQYLKMNLPRIPQHDKTCVATWQSLKVFYDTTSKKWKFTYNRHEYDVENETLVRVNF